MLSIKDIQKWVNQTNTQQSCFLDEFDVNEMSIRSNNKPMTNTEPIMIVTTVNEKLMWAQDQRIKQFEEHLKYLENQETIRQQTQSLEASAAESSNSSSSTLPSFTQQFLSLTLETSPSKTNSKQRKSLSNGDNLLKKVLTRNCSRNLSQSK